MENDVNITPPPGPDAYFRAWSRTASLRPVPIPHVILNANGSPSVRATRTRALRRGGYMVIEAVDCSEALRAGLAEQPDVIVMNGLSGAADLKICAQLRAEPAMHGVPLISLCPSHRKAHARYVDLCFQEPIKPTTLISIVGLVLQVKAAREFLQAAAPNDGPRATAETRPHDLLSPLCTISSLAAWIRGEYEDQLGAGGREYLGLLEQSVERMREVIVKTFAVSTPAGRPDRFKTSKG